MCNSKSFDIKCRKLKHAKIYPLKLSIEIKICGNMLLCLDINLKNRIYAKTCFSKLSKSKKMLKYNYII